MTLTRSAIDALVSEMPPGHTSTSRVLRAVACGVAPLLVGPAGCGKSTVCSRVASTLGLPFAYARAVQDPYALLGFVNAHGAYVTTPFRTIFERGGVFLLDEIDGGSPNALLAFNEALANGNCDFPDGNVRAHPDFRIVAAANTHGTGADRQYVGRNQLDGTTLDRFVLLEMTYDRAMERTLGAPDWWTTRVHAVRDAVSDLGIRHIVSTRAITQGARMLAAGFFTEEVEAAVLWRGLPLGQIERLKARAAPCTTTGAPTGVVDGNPTVINDDGAIDVNVVQTMGRSLRPGGYSREPGVISILDLPREPGLFTTSESRTVVLDNMWDILNYMKTRDRDATSSLVPPVPPPVSTNTRTRNTKRELLDQLNPRERNPRKRPRK